MINWIAKNTDLPAELQVVSLVSLGTKLFLADQNNGVYKSIDKAASWVNINNDLPESNILSLFSFGFGLYASTFENGVYRTIDDGVTWVTVDGLESFYINAIVQVGPVAYVGGADYDGVGHIYVTEDGTTFEESLTGLPSYENCLSLTKFDDYVYAGISGSGIYILVDDEWSIVSANIPYSLVSNSTYIFAFVGSGTHYYSSDGETWTALTISADDPFIVKSVFHGKNLYAGGYKRVDSADSPVIYRSNDGLTWEDVSDGLEGSPVGGIASLGDNLYCCANGTGNPGATPPVGGTGGLPPNCISQDMVFSDVISTGMTVSWTSGLGEKRFLVVSTAPITCRPVNLDTYSVSDVFCGGAVKYNGTGATVAITGLTIDTLYYFALFEYNGLAGSEVYYPVGLYGEQATSSVAVLPTTPIIAAGSSKMPSSTIGISSDNTDSYNIEVYDTTDVLMFSINGVLPDSTVGITSSLAYLLHDAFTEDAIFTTPYSGSLATSIENAVVTFDGSGAPSINVGSRLISHNSWDPAFGAGDQPRTSAFYVNPYDNELTYRFKVKAVNGEGESAWAEKLITPLFDNGQVSLLGVSNDGSFGSFSTVTTPSKNVDITTTDGDVFPGGTFQLDATMGVAWTLQSFKDYTVDIIALV